jgi:tetratricopeptide (TPR) repeat protein
MSEILNLINDARRAAFEHRFEDAARSASNALERLPTCLTALRILAWARLELEDDAALETFERCANADPEDALAYVGQAIWHQERGNIEAAITNWTRAWELDPHNQAIRRGLVKLTRELPESPLADAISLLRNGLAAEGVEALKRMRSQRRDAAVEAALLSVLWAVGAHAEAFDVAHALLSHTPNCVKAALYVAALEDRAGRTLRSREAIARAEQADPGLTLFADVVQQVGLQPALDLHRATRTPLAAAR